MIELQSQLPPGRTLPLVIQPAQPVADAAAWAASQRPWIEQQLRVHGALVFRRFPVDSPPSFEGLVRAISQDLPRFKEESSPRSVVSGSVYTSTDYPPEFPIQFHTEYSYSFEWPMKLYFCCLQPPAAGGQTPIADTRKVLQRISPAVRDRFRREGVLYVRNYFPARMGVSWQKAFGTQDREEVERHCRQAGVECQWGEKDTLSTRQRAPAIVRHPGTGEEVWFNHAFFFNVRAIEPLEVRQYMLTLKPEKLSTNTYFGGGDPIDEATLEELRAAYREEAVGFDWERGDVLLIDNMLTAHSRTPYTPPRQIVVAMAESCRRTGLGV